jgi:hypothetical protein
MSDNLTSVAVKEVMAHMSVKHEVTRFAKQECDIFLPDDRYTGCIWTRDFLIGEKKVS